jgi:hypothetical protein
MWLQDVTESGKVMAHMSTSVEIIKRVRGMSADQLRHASAATGIPLPTISKVRYGVTTDPRASLIDALRDYFEQQDKQAA